jgi:hypothetical protein
MIGRAAAVNPNRPQYACQEEPGIRRGVHYHRLESDLSQAKTGQVLAVLKIPEILDVLTRRPIKEIVIRRLAEKSTSAFYVYGDQSHHGEFGP